MDRAVLREVHRHNERLAATLTAFVRHQAGRMDDETRALIQDTGALVGLIRADLPNPPKKRRPGK